MKLLKQEWVKGSILAGFFAMLLIIIYDAGKKNGEIETSKLKDEIESQKEYIKLLRDSFTNILLGKAP